MRLRLVDDDVPRETVELLRAACVARGVEVDHLDAKVFSWDPDLRCRPGDLLFRPAVSLAAMRVEHFLWAPGAATFYARPGRIDFTPFDAAWIHERSGVPVPPTVYGSTLDRDVLRGHVERLGGLPVVVKILGGSGGLGVIKVDAWPTLFSVIEYAVSLGNQPLVQAFVPDAVHWRCVVVGSRVVAAYRNVQLQDDFRTYGSSDPADVCAPPPGMAEVAVRAVACLELEHGGVDVLETPDGRHLVLEANFPCYFPHAQLVSGVDVAGAMVEHLLRKARASAGGAAPSDEPAASASPTKRPARGRRQSAAPPEPARSGRSSARKRPTSGR